MPRRAKYASEEERQEARREQKRRAQAKIRAERAEKDGREVKPRKSSKSQEERVIAAMEWDRKRNDNRKEKRTKSKTPWVPAFVGVDGESFVIPGEYIRKADGTYARDSKGKKVPKQAYYLLLRSDKEELFTGEPLTTYECLNYLTSNIPKKTAIVGYFLNFDFEWILKDVTEEEYLKLREGEIVTPECCGGLFKVRWFMGKKLEVHRLKSQYARQPMETWSDKKAYFTTILQDSSGFFQSGFVPALKKWGFENDERLDIIVKGKAARGGFRLEGFDEVNIYNKMEMELLVELMHKVYGAFKEGYEAAGLKYSVNSTSWAGPGGFASDFLKQTNWSGKNTEHELPPVEQAAAFAQEREEYFGNDAAKNYPFSLAYYGGRIELAAVGKFKPNRAQRRAAKKNKTAVYNYDINSAYPYALSLLPIWTADDFRVYEGAEAEEVAKLRPMGMFGVTFKFPEGWTWYPFPVREYLSGSSATVYYPRHGTTNIMGPELYAILDNLTEFERKQCEIYINYAYVLDNTEGYGDAINQLPEERLCTTAKKVKLMAKKRLECKKAASRLGTPEEQEGDAKLAWAEKALKLILNSLYGKTVQQVGAHTHYNDFASAWITSVCRALLWRALHPERASHNVIMTMTDGIYSRVPLPFAADRVSDILGEWDAEEFTYFETFKPGVYRYEKKGKMEYKVRGFLTPTVEDKELLFSQIWESVSRGTLSHFPSVEFKPRILAREGWQMEPFVRQFVEGTTVIEAELRRKREPNDSTGWLIPEGEENIFFAPKRGYAHKFYMNQSIGYSLDFEGERLKVNDESGEDYYNYLIDSTIGLEENYLYNAS